MNAEEEVLVLRDRVEDLQSALEDAEVRAEKAEAGRKAIEALYYGHFSDMAPALFGDVDDDEWSLDDVVRTVLARCNELEGVTARAEKAEARLAEVAERATTNASEWPKAHSVTDLFESLAGIARGEEGKS